MKEQKMSNKLTGAGANSLEVLDFNTAIAACDLAINPPPPKTKSSAKTTSQPAPTAADYLCRAYARCFVDEKDNANFNKAIADCSTAIALNPTLYTAYRIRAYAYYMKGDYAIALEDCTKVRDKGDAEDCAFVLELLTKIYLDAEQYEAVIKEIKAFLPRSNSNVFYSLSIMETYKQACQKLQSNK
ncbi:MAG: hypothetical protein LBT24_04565 [Tannerella sp.]|jgi:tetratricopeptide (TPR) repeat protein|nr:hypothetical protein [Tannerella sp.]